jgi:acetylornithine deacetylase/succinyl-diaminopimelate desuccinylase-like protein
MHKVDEHVPTQDIVRLTDIYEAVLRGYFKGQVSS